MEFRFNLNEIFKKPIVEVGQTLIPSDFKGDRRGLWDALSKITDVINAMGTASAAAQNLTRPITTADRLRNSEQQQVYLLIDHDAFNGKGAVTGMLKTGKKGLYVFDREGHHYHVQSPCVLDFYIHESRQRSGYGKKLFEHMLQREEVHPEKLAIDRPSEKFLGFLNKHYSLSNPIRQMNNYVVYDGFFPQVGDKGDKSPINNNGDSVSKRGSNGLQAQIVTSPYGRYGAPRPPCSMGQIIHNQSAAMPVQEPTGEFTLNSGDDGCYQQNISTQPQTGGGPGHNDNEYHWPFVIPSADYPMQVRHSMNTSNNMYDLLQPGLIKQEICPPSKVPIDELGRPQQNPPQKVNYQMVHRSESRNNPAVHHLNKAHQANKVVDEGVNGATIFNHFSRPITPQLQQTGTLLSLPEDQYYSNLVQQTGNNNHYPNQQGMNSQQYIMVNPQYNLQEISQNHQPQRNFNAMGNHHYQPQQNFQAMNQEENAHINNYQHPLNLQSSQNGQNLHQSQNSERVNIYNQQQQQQRDYDVNKQQQLMATNQQIHNQQGDENLQGINQNNQQGQQKQSMQVISHQEQQPPVQNVHAIKNDNQQIQPNLPVMNHNNMHNPQKNALGQNQHNVQAVNNQHQQNTQMINQHNDHQQPMLNQQAINNQHPQVHQQHLYGLNHQHQPIQQNIQAINPKNVQGLGHQQQQAINNQYQNIQGMNHQQQAMNKLENVQNLQTIDHQNQSTQQAINNQHQQIRQNVQPMNYQNLQGTNIQYQPMQQEIINQQQQSQQNVQHMDYQNLQAMNRQYQTNQQVINDQHQNVQAMSNQLPLQQAINNQQNQNVEAMNSKNLHEINHQHQPIQIQQNNQAVYPQNTQVMSHQQHQPNQQVINNQNQQTQQNMNVKNPQHFQAMIHQQPPVQQAINKQQNQIKQNVQHLQMMNHQQQPIQQTIYNQPQQNNQAIDPQNHKQELIQEAVNHQFEQNVEAMNNQNLQRISHQQQAINKQQNIHTINPQDLQAMNHQQQTVNNQQNQYQENVVQPVNPQYIQTVNQQQHLQPINNQLLQQTGNYYKPNNQQTPQNIYQPSMNSLHHLQKEEKILPQGAQMLNQPQLQNLIQDNNTGNQVQPQLINQIHQPINQVNYQHPAKLNDEYYNNVQYHNQQQMKVLEPLIPTCTHSASQIQEIVRNTTTQRPVTVHTNEKKSQPNQSSTANTHQQPIKQDFNQPKVKQSPHMHSYGDFDRDQLNQNMKYSNGLQVQNTVEGETFMKIATSDERLQPTEPLQRTPSNYRPVTGKQRNPLEVLKTLSGIVLEQQNKKIPTPISPLDRNIAAAIRRSKNVSERQSQIYCGGQAKRQGGTQAPPKVELQETPQPKLDRPQTLPLLTSSDDHFQGQSEVHEINVANSELDNVENDFMRIEVSPRPAEDEAGDEEPQARKTPSHLTDQGYFDLKFYHNKLW